MTCNVSDMKNGLCPKCGARDIRVQRGSRRPDDFRNYLSLGWWSSGARVYNYACIACGYLESYIDAADLMKVAGKWDRVAPGEPA